MLLYPRHDNSLHSADRAIRRPAHRAFTLVELLIAMTISTMLLFGLTGAIMISTRAAEVGAGSTTDRKEARALVAEVTRDLHFATQFTERSATAAEFLVPDRDGDGQPEILRYAWGGVPGTSSGPLTREYNGGSAVEIAADVEDFRLLYEYRTIEGVPPEPVAGGGVDLLMVVIDAGSPSAQDLARKSKLEAWGYDPATISASAPPAEFASAVAAADLAYVAPQNGSTILGTKLRDVAIGVVSEEIMVAEAFGFAESTDDIGPTDTIEILDNTQYVATPFGTGDLVVANSNQAVVALKGFTADGLLTVARFQTPSSRPCLAVIDTGGGLYGGGTAAARRVQLPWGAAGFDFNELNDDGLTLLARALAWVDGAGPAPPTTFGYTTEFPTLVSNVRRIQIATKATLAEAGTVTALTAFIGGDVSRVRYAIYADDGGEPGSLVVESNGEATPLEDVWFSIPVPAAPLAAGDYWIALAFKSSSQHYHQSSPGSTRYRNNNAERDGFLANWGGSDDSFAISVSIYAEYQPN